ncbi:hypothetical protein UA08_01802 [Talaromyces atroroseus]|uniref:Uncharacterized protein n=1 Tax=Talaromyces atroroseus TaxID=1441469 RepID=A0A1Q5QBI8_TALAT|nr:hypothetical protein UA08_01802 [Talaromyces atroroseus]OKL63317.1 hypothetical protein UA08_01802 [Talaromyces atroroseus]
MEPWFKLSLLLASIAATLIILSTVVLYKSSRPKSLRPRHVNIEENNIVSNNLPDSPPFNSWVNSWSWLRRYNTKGYEPVPVSESDANPVSPIPPTDIHEPPAKDPPIARLEYNILNVDLERGVPKALHPEFDRTTDKRRSRGKARFINRENGKNERTPLLSRSRSVSPYKPTFPPGRGGSMPIDIPKKKTERPTFPLPPKLIWKTLTPYERAGMVWWRN